MDDEKKKQIKNGVREEFRVGRARLFRVETERKVRAEIAEDRTRIFTACKQLGQQPELELTQKLGRLLMNFSKLASYRGVLEGYHLFQTGIKLGEDRARFYLVEYLQTHPDAENSELIRYLDRKNGRLSALKTSQNDPLWAWLPRSWNEEFRRRGTELQPGEFWETATGSIPRACNALPKPRQENGEAAQSQERAVCLASHHQRAPKAPEERRRVTVRYTVNLSSSDLP